MSSLYVMPRNSPDEAYRVWPNPVDIPAGVVRESQDYVFELRDAEDPLHVDLFVDEYKLEALRPRNTTTAVWLWSPGFHAGSVECSLVGPANRKVNFEVTTDTDLRKLSRDEYNLLLEEILQDTTALFSLSSFRKGVGKGRAGSLPPIARLQYLRDKLNELTTAVKAINSRPQKILNRERTMLPLHRVKRVTGNEILRSYRSGRVQFSNNLELKLPSKLRNMIPTKIEQTKVCSVLDIREHREIKASLLKWKAWVSRVGSLITQRASSKVDFSESDSRNSYINWARKCKIMENDITSLLGLPLFESIPNEATLPRLSPIYQKLPAYRKFYSIYRDFNLGLSNVFGDFLNIPLSRTFDLYEMWSFLRLLRAAAKKWSVDGKALKSVFEPASDQYDISVKSGVIIVPLNESCAIAFQRSYREYWLEDDKLGSFTRTMIPDISFSMSADALDKKLIVLDSKYRIKNNINDAISSIHMYRDALVNETEEGVESAVVGAYLISPHLPNLTKPWKDIASPGRFFHPEYRGGFKFGAVTMRPGMTLKEVGLLLDEVVSDVS
jgi:hypothetical protein